MVDDTWVDNPLQLKKEVKSFFEKRFKEDRWNNPTLDGVPFIKLSENENARLCANFDPQEIKEAVWDCASDKSPGPDGYNFLFIKHFWHFLEGDVKHELDDFHAHGTWPRGSNPSFIALIPKVDSPLGLNDFRPISLIGCIYKIVSKILANQLKEALPKIIGDEQSAFLQGRNMLDSIVVTNEVIHDARCKKKQTLLFNVDFEKAYDSVNWRFFFYMMRRLNFCERWVQWMESCLKSSRVSVLVNGSPTYEFGIEKGLRQ